MELSADFGTDGLCPRCLMDTVVTDLTSLDHPALTATGPRTFDGADSPPIPFAMTR